MVTTKPSNIRNSGPGCAKERKSYPHQRMRSWSEVPPHSNARIHRRWPYRPYLPVPIRHVDLTKRRTANLMLHLLMMEIDEYPLVVGEHLVFSVSSKWLISPDLNFAIMHYPLGALLFKQRKSPSTLIYPSYPVAIYTKKTHVNLKRNMRSMSPIWQI